MNRLLIEKQVLDTTTSVVGLPEVGRRIRCYYTYYPGEYTGTVTEVAPEGKILFWYKRDSYGSPRAKFTKGHIKDGSTWIYID